MKNTILLFDMDGVLLEPRGYHRALQETVKRLGTSLGFQDVELPQPAIHRFEALGITSEWDSAAVCYALLLKTLHKQKLSGRFQSGGPADKKFRPPDWDRFLAEVALRVDDGREPLQAAADLLEDQLPLDDRAQVRSILDAAHQPSSLVHSTFQELVLGSETFQAIYNQPPQISARSYLTRYDRPVISPRRQKALQNWFNPHRRGAVVTNRPTRPPGLKSGSPEGEMGAALVGLADLPLIGYGELTWLAIRKNRPVRSLHKPQPTHALAGMLAAAGADLSRALDTAFQLTEGKYLARVKNLLHQSRVVIFEDTTAGLISLKTAAGVLDSFGIRLETVLVGIAADAQKRQALQGAGARVYPDLNRALQVVPGFH